MSDARDVLVGASNIQDLLDLNDWMDDEDYTEALAKVVNVIVREEISPEKCAKLVVKFAAWGAIFNQKAQTYMTIKKAKAGTDNNMKKNVYFAISKDCYELSAALKYMVRL